MSKFGLKIGDKEHYIVNSPEEALDLVSRVLEQFFGPYWTQHKPQCPLCNTELEDFEKHMNRPVGVCTNEKCESTIHPADYMGKIKDILGEWAITKERLDEEKAKQEKIAASQPDHKETSTKKAVKPKSITAASDVGTPLATDAQMDSNGKPVYMW